MIVFGPVPSRRLGRSLGINNIPPKICPYSCVYCQLGRTRRESIERQVFHDPAAVLDQVQAKVAACRRSGEAVDYLTFVPDGEPTLDLNLGWSIRALRSLGLPIAVISNAALIDRPGVRRDLALADWVSLKVDTVDEASWRAIDRPHGHLRLAPILAGLEEFAASFTGRLTTETMLLSDLNDSEAELLATARFVRKLQPASAYLAVPTRPPAEDWARPPSAEALARAYAVFSGQAGQVEVLAGYEGDAFASTGDLREDLLSITAVHPMREDAVRKLVAGAGGDWGQVTALIRARRLLEVGYRGHRYYLRPLCRNI